MCRLASIAILRPSLRKLCGLRIRADGKYSCSAMHSGQQTILLGSVSSLREARLRHALSISTHEGHRRCLVPKLERKVSAIIAMSGRKGKSKTVYRRKMAPKPAILRLRYDGVMSMKQRCPVCKGRCTDGNGRACQACQGKGEVESQPIFSISIGSKQGPVATKGRHS